MIDNFNTFLLSIDEVNGDSKKSYASYLKGLCSNFLDEYILKEFGYNAGFLTFINSLKQDLRSKIFTICDVYLDYLIKIKDSSIRSAKTLSNYRSGFKRFEEYVFSEDFENVKKKSKVDDTTKQLIVTKFNNLGTITYTKRDLTKTFLFRLKTQDRCYDFIRYPIRLIWKLVTKENLQEKIVRSMRDRLNDMDCYISKDGKAIKYEKVRKLTISNGKSYVNGKELYTELFNDGSCSSIKYDLMQPELSLMSIDHVKPQYEMMKENLQNYPYLQRITNQFNKTVKQYGLKDKTTSAKANTLVYDEINSKWPKQDVSSLVDETTSLIDSMKFALMDKSENSKKNKKLI